MRTHLDAGDVQGAIGTLNDRLRAGANDGDRALLLLERATLRAEAGQLAESAHDFELADRALDLSDMIGAGRDRRSRGPGVDVTGCIQGSPTCPYRTIPAEKLMINAMSALVFLSMHRADEAAVEGRRIDVSRRFLDDRNMLPRDVLSLASFFAALAFEKNGDAGSAASSWKDVPVEHLPATPPKDDGEDVVVVVGYGRGPTKAPASTKVRLLAAQLEDPSLRAAAERSEKSISTTVLLEPSDHPVTLRLDGGVRSPELTWDVGAEVTREWRAVERARLPSRVSPVVDCERAHPTWLCGFAADTRNWETLPARFVVTRLRVGAGAHRLVAEQDGERRVFGWTSHGDGWRVVPLFFAR